MLLRNSVTLPVTAFDAPKAASTNACNGVTVVTESIGEKIETGRSLVANGGELPIRRYGRYSVTPHTWQGFFVPNAVTGGAELAFRRRATPQALAGKAQASTGARLATVSGWELSEVPLLPQLPPRFRIREQRTKEKNRKWIRQ